MYRTCTHQHSATSTPNIWVRAERNCSFHTTALQPSHKCIQSTEPERSGIGNRSRRYGTGMASCVEFLNCFFSCPFVKLDCLGHLRANFPFVPRKQSSIMHTLFVDGWEGILWRFLPFFSSMRSALGVPVEIHTCTALWSRSVLFKW